MPHVPVASVVKMRALSVFQKFGITRWSSVTKIEINDLPSGVGPYSTLGGVSSKSRLSTMPCVSRSHSLGVGIFCEMPATDVGG